MLDKNKRTPIIKTMNNIQGYKQKQFIQNNLTQTIRQIKKQALLTLKAGIFIHKLKKQKQIQKGRLTIIRQKQQFLQRQIFQKNNLLMLQKKQQKKQVHRLKAMQNIMLNDYRKKIRSLSSQNTRQHSLNQQKIHLTEQLKYATDSIKLQEITNYKLKHTKHIRMSTIG